MDSRAQDIVLVREMDVHFSTHSKNIDQPPLQTLQTYIVLSTVIIILVISLQFVR